MAERATTKRTGRDIVIVDPNFNDYSHLLNAEEAQQWNFHFLRTGQAAMRYVMTGVGDLWLINASLPDMCGFELHRTIRRQLRKRPAIVVADQYDSQQELAAYTEHFTAYVGKPVDVTWLRERSTVSPSMAR